MLIQVESLKKEIDDLREAKEKLEREKSHSEEERRKQEEEIKRLEGRLQEMREKLKKAEEMKQETTPRISPSRVNNTSEQVDVRPKLNLGENRYQRTSPRPLSPASLETPARRGIIIPGASNTARDSRNGPQFYTPVKGDEAAKPTFPKPLEDQTQDETTPKRITNTLLNTAPKSNEKEAPSVSNDLKNEMDDG